MAKQTRRRSSSGKWRSRSASSLLILCMFWLLFQLANSLTLNTQVKLPGSETPVKLYSNQTQDNLTQLYQQMIQSAQHSIVLAIYGLTDETIIQAIKKKWEAGVPVHIVCDGKASKKISTRLPGPVIVKKFGPGLMHQKILIIDNRFILLGSANLTHGSLNIHDNLVLGLDHPSLAQVLTERITSMDNEGAYNPLLHQESTAGAQKLELWVLPDDAAAANRMIELFRAAKKSIRVAMFTFTREDFTQELLAAAERGVKVEAVVDRSSGRKTSAKIVRMLQKGGIPITWSSGQGLLHHKFAYIDETILVNGSANWTRRAFKENDDYFVVIDPLTSDQQIKMNQLCDVIKHHSEVPVWKKKAPSRSFR